MRYLIPALLILAALWYFTTGVRLGMVTYTPTIMFNANGKSTYTVRAAEERQQVGIAGTCKVTSGVATIRLLSPGGTQVAGQACERAPNGQAGNWSVNLLGSGNAGLYKVVLEYKNFSGQLELNEVITATR